MPNLNYMGTLPTLIPKACIRGHLQQSHSISRGCVALDAHHSAVVLGLEPGGGYVCPNDGEATYEEIR
jgi:hypothetical protein